VRHEVVLQVQQVHCLAAGVFVVFVGPASQRIEVVVNHFAFEIHRGAGHLDVLVHPAVFALAAALAEQAQHPHRENPPVAHQPPLKRHAAAAQ